MHCALKNRADLHINERQKIRHYRARSTVERRRRRIRRKKNAKSRFLTSRGAYVNCAIIAMLYTHSIGNQPWWCLICLIVYLAGDIPAGGYSSVSNVLRKGESHSSLLIESTHSMITNKHCLLTPINSIPKHLHLQAKVAKETNCTHLHAQQITHTHTHAN